MKNLLCVLAAAVFCSLSSAAQSATITWGSATQIAGDTDVINGGTLVNATNVDGSSVTVNGTAFTGAGETAGSVIQGNLTISVSGGLSPAGGAYSSGAAPFNTLSGNYQNVVGSGNYQDSGNTETITYTGLLTGHQYEFQFFVNDSRTCCSNNLRNETLTAGNSVNLPYYNLTGVDGNLGTFAIGTFVTTSGDAGTQVISVFSPSGNIQNNALVLQDLGLVPEPASCVLLGLGALGLLAVGRRRKA